MDRFKISIFIKQATMNSNFSFLNILIMNSYAFHLNIGIIKFSFFCNLNKIELRGLITISNRFLLFESFF